MHIFMWNIICYEPLLTWRQCIPYTNLSTNNITTGEMHCCERLHIRGDAVKVKRFSTLVYCPGPTWCNSAWQPSASGNLHCHDNRATRSKVCLLLWTRLSLSWWHNNKHSVTTSPIEIVRSKGEHAVSQVRTDTHWLTLDPVSLLGESTTHMGIYSA